MLALIAKYYGKCTKCKGRIRKGDPIGFDRYRHITLCTKCHTERRLQMEHEARNTAAYVQAQEEAYFERHHEDYVFFERITDYIH